MSLLLIGWNVGVSILSPLNGLLFINFVPVTTLVISAIQGNQITSYELIGVVFIVFSLIANNIFVRLIQKKMVTKRFNKVLNESVS